MAGTLLLVLMLASATSSNLRLRTSHQGDAPVIELLRQGRCTCAAKKVINS